MGEYRTDIECMVVADEVGNILAMADLGYGERHDSGAPSHVEVVALEGQVVHRVKMPEELAHTDLAADEVFRAYHLQVEGPEASPEARLVRRSTSSG